MAIRKICGNAFMPRGRIHVPLRLKNASNGYVCRMQPLSFVGGALPATILGRFLNFAGMILAFHSFNYLNKK